MALHGRVPGDESSHPRQTSRRDHWFASAVYGLEKVRSAVDGQTRVMGLCGPVTSPALPGTCTRISSASGIFRITFLGRAALDKRPGLVCGSSHWTVTEEFDPYRIWRYAHWQRAARHATFGRVFHWWLMALLLFVFLAGEGNRHQWYNYPLFLWLLRSPTWHAILPCVHVHNPRVQKLPLSSAVFFMLRWRICSTALSNRFTNLSPSAFRHSKWAIP